MRFGERVRRGAQRNDREWMWSWSACVFLVGIVSFMVLVRRLKNITNKNDHHAKMQAIFSLVYLGLFCLLLLALHVVLVWHPLKLRKSRFFRTTPSPLVIAFGCTFTTYLPLSCAVEGSLGEEALDVYSLAAVIFVIADFFCLHMAILPAYDYQIVHMALSITGTIVLSVTRGHSLLRYLWVPLAAFVTISVLALHQWLTPPVPAVYVNEVIVDARIGPYPPYPEPEPEPQPVPEPAPEPEPLQFIQLQQWFNAQLVQLIQLQLWFSAQLVQLQQWLSAQSLSGVATYLFFLALLIALIEFLVRFSSSSTKGSSH